MKRTLFIMLLGLFTTAAFGQDIIYLSDGTTVKAKISEINDGDIKYKRFDNQSGPTYTISRTKTEKIVFENGVEENVLVESSAAKSNPGGEEYSKASWYNPNKWTSQTPIGLSLYADLGGMFFTGPRIGVGARWRQLEVDGFFKAPAPGAMNRLYYEFEDVFISEGSNKYAKPYHYRGGGGGFTVKVLFPVGTKGCTLHAGVLNEWNDTHYQIDGYDTYRSVNNQFYVKNRYSATGLGGGFSWHHNSGMYLLVGGYWGVMVLNKYKQDCFYNDSMHYNTDTSRWVAFYGICELTVGYEIPLMKSK